MGKRMTIVFDNEALYTALKAEAMRTGRHVNQIVCDAVREWVEAKEDEELVAGLDEIRAEWERNGGIEAGQLFRQLKIEREAQK